MSECQTLGLPQQECVECWSVVVVMNYLSIPNDYHRIRRLDQMEFRKNVSKGKEEKIFNLREVRVLKRNP